MTNFGFLLGCADFVPAAKCAAALCTRRALWKLDLQQREGPRRLNIFMKMYVRTFLP
jgi:hypothetical protein